MPAVALTPGAPEPGGSMNRSHLSLALTAAFALALPSTASSQVAMSCNDHAVLSTCDHHEPEVFAILGAEFFQGICELSGGRWAAEPCPAGDVVGVCDDGSGSTWTYYSTGGNPYDASRALVACQEIGGTFTAASALVKLKTCSDHAVLSVCSEHTPEAVALLTEPVLAQICGLTDGVWGSQPCPLASRAGSCSDGSGSTTILYADGGSPYDVAAAQQFCIEVGGSFTALAPPPPPQPSATSPRSCNDITQLGICSDFQPSAFTVLGEAVYKEMCALTEGIWSADPCPTARRVGSCDDGAGGRVHFYSVGGITYDATTAKAGCTDMMGIWVPVP